MNLSSGEQSEALRLLNGLESGLMSTSDAYNIASKLDPILFYFVVRFLREAFANDEELNQAINRRVADLFSPHPDLVKAFKESEQDIMREWFDDAYSCKQFRSNPEGFIELVYDKLES